jgi:D-serine deaminase-like pyridoxal phosphate-dependent protein
MLSRAMGEHPSWESYREAIAGRRLPLAFCDVGLYDDNARAMLARAAGLPVRVASKSLRCRALLERALAIEGYRGVMCFTAREAAVLAGHGLDDLLVAYPTVDETELGEALERVAAGARIRFVVDDVEQVARIDRAAKARGATAELCIDVDMSSAFPGLWFGVRRSPVREVEGALRVARSVGERAAVRLVGVLGYEAQIAGLPDAVPGKAAVNAVVRMLKRRSIRELTERRGAIVRALRDEGFTIELVNGGGTGSLESTARDPSVTELTAGSGFFSPALFDAFRGFHHAPAAGFALPVVRRPAPGIVTCHGGGYVASGAAGPDRLPVPYLPAGARLLAQEGAGEVQTPVVLPRGVEVALGDPIFFRHAKAGELCERFESLVLIENGKVVDEVPTYRGEGYAFL